ncbi:DUF1501 domain-containing protein [Neolewinella antarctica]|uniref:Uncharacterized protein (DUF1501 family) n=1 Tax=Neolewinella antarctica TaxID=442734 RepID=A0ABX0XBB6_9BACT|nr:DUF1501 domain-containing protein [Neolewinella antarctica]NJC26219.1 uncharacterized protein (DUF1501 family) [Neolewinella antarctica]
MDRRNFLRRGGALSLPLLAGFSGIQAAGSSFLTNLLPPGSDRVLVLIQLNGGNDGLNTLVPIDQMGALQNVRPNVYQPKSSLKALTTSLALHSRMGGMQGLFTEGKMSIVQDVGYPNQNRSHFRSADIWTSGSNATTTLETGWVARHLETEFVGFPTDFPTSSQPHPPAISMGNIGNATCQGYVTNVSQTVKNPSELTLLAPGGNTPLPDDNYGDQLDFLRTAIEQTNEYGVVIKAAAESGATSATYQPGPLREQLQNVVRLISGGLQTQVYVVQLGGFDTHATQVNGNNTTQGRHADLLGQLSDGIAAFQTDLEEQGIADRVLGMTFSEFGRRIRSNGSNGTDHGTAAPMFLFGNCVSGTVLGDNPTIDTQIDQNEGVPMQYDFRDVYGSVLTDWFGVREADVRTLLYPGFVYLPVANGCASALPVELLNFTAAGDRKQINLAWQTTLEENNDGFEVQRSEDGKTFRRIGWVTATTDDGAGVHDYVLADSDVVTGPLYYYRLKQRDLDGNFEYSPARTARLTGSALGDWSVGNAFPNPATEETTVQVYAPTDGRVSYSVFNVGGQRIMQDSAVLIGRRDTRIKIRFGRVPPGIYTIRFDVNSSDYRTQKIIIR